MTSFGEVEVDERVLLKWILKKYSVRMWAWIHYAQDLVQWRAAANMATRKGGNFLTSSATISFSRRIMRNAVCPIYIISVHVKVYCEEHRVVFERPGFKSVDMFQNSLMSLRECST